MLIQGCDFHPSFQQIAIFDNRTGEMQEKRLQHREEAEQFYRWLAGQPVRVGMEACGHSPWFERLLAELGFELGLGDAAEIRARVVGKQKTDRRDAEPLLTLVRQDRFSRIWVPSRQERDVRQWLMQRHKQVQARTRVKNPWQAMALSQECRRSGSCGAQRGGRSWRSWSGCPTRRNGGSNCCHRWRGWKWRSSHGTGGRSRKRPSGRRR
jgi:transposase